MLRSCLHPQVLGNAKGVVAAAVSVAVFKNIVTLQGATGYAITVTGVFLYSAAKRRYKTEAVQGVGGRKPPPSGIASPRYGQLPSDEDPQLQQRSPHAPRLQAQTSLKSKLADVTFPRVS